MSKITTLIYLFQRQPFSLHCRLSQTSHSLERYFSTKSDGSDDEKDNHSLNKKETQNSMKDSKAKPEKGTLSKEETKQEAKKKLFSLLSEMTIVPDSKTKAGENLRLARPAKRISKQERFKEEIRKHREMQKSPEDKLQDAAKVVATNVKGDVQQTLAELNERLRKLNLASSSQTPLETENEKILDDETSKNFMSSVKEIAATVADGSAPRSKLAERLLKISTEKKSSGFKRPLDDFVKGMKIEKQTSEDRRRKEFESKDFQKRTPRSSMVPKARINILDAAPLNIFQISKEPIKDAEKTVWQTLEEKNLRLLTQFAPANGFEEMIMWTEQGKHWKFPIDNQTELAGEENVGFHEHVFLEQHLHGFPTKGPVRHFMELVVVGLSKNPYISVERKIENIDWFREYFKEKEDILKATGALG
ncbi:28S ribosomal protein S31, mitochondrial-like isoform X1 [Argiope bruennichi]|uniref:28S ribosomal protein S31, mitochondrial-like isoform X1 n=1 Tax=Argiope bruennichi TaxID=94029 RepID=UPI00249415E7|nr:28S ribosomal protein S31, mitochondrial-like isoform X1 [Argiope bruennichi]